jgi:hypothetical protein
MDDGLPSSAGGVNIKNLDFCCSVRVSIFRPTAHVSLGKD